MVFEDAHWIDPTSLEVLEPAMQRIAALPVLLIVTFRPEFEPPWTGRPHVTTLTLNRLAQRDIDAVIDLVVGNKVLPANLRQDIIERTDGIPLSATSERARARARDRPRRYLDVRADAHLVGTHPFWTVCGSKCGSR
jgi:predicted ATPase